MSYNKTLAALSADACNGLTIGTDGNLVAPQRPQMLAVSGTTAPATLNDAAIAATLANRTRIAPRINVSLNNPSACESLLAQITFFMGLSEIIAVDGNIWEWGIGQYVSLSAPGGGLSDARVRFFGTTSLPATPGILRDSSRVLVNQDVQIIPPGGTLYVAGDVYFQAANYAASASNGFTTQGLSVLITAWGT